MKKIFLIFLTFSMLFTLISCKKTSNKAVDKNNIQNTVAAMPAVNFNVTQDDEIADYYAIKNDGTSILTLYKSDLYGATSYIALNGADTLNITMIKGGDYGLAFYDEHKSFISFVNSPEGDDLSAVFQEISIPSNAKYFKTTYFNYANRRKYGSFSYTLLKNGKEIKQNGKRENIGEEIYFSREISQTLDSEATENVKATTGVLTLPNSYTKDGTPTKLIIYFHGYSHYVYYGKWGSTESFRAQKQNFLENGYAVLDCNGARDNETLGKFVSAGSPQFVDAYWKCYQYAIENYNIDDKVYLVGGSAGGPTAINFATTHSENVKGLLLISAWTDIHQCAWNQNIRDSFVEYLGFENTTAYENEKADKYNPARLISQKDGVEYVEGFPVPVCGFIGANEINQNNEHIYDPFMRWMKALKNSAPETVIKEWEGEGHNIVSGAVKEVDDAICNWFNTLG